LSKRIDWKDFIRKNVKELLDRSPRYRFPTIRSVYYYLGSVGLIPLTEYGYKKLDSLLVDMRINGEVPWGYFTVVRGVSGRLGRKFISPEAHLQRHILWLKECDTWYEVPFWYKQPLHLELWVEKKGLLPTLEYWLREYDVKVRSGEGYSPWEFVYISVEDILTYLEDRTTEKVLVLYLGDLDPSGVDIDRHVQEATRFFGINLTFKRLALLPEQVKQYNLPPWPEKMKVIEKLRKDPRRKWYFWKYGEIATELDAWFGLNPDSLRKLILEYIDQHIDLEAKKQRDQLNQQLKQQLKEKLAKLKIVFEEE